VKHLFPALAAALMVLGLSTHADARRAQTRAEPLTPQAFIQKVGNSNQFEIQSSKLALQKSHNDAIRNFAQRMIDDHTKLGDQFRQELKQANMPEPGAEMGKEQQAGLDRLEKLNGAAFDAAYIRAQRMGHEQLIRFAQEYSKRGTNQPLKQFALHVLPELKEHEKLASELRGPRSMAARR
jgi:putative membrane protein